MSGNNGSVHPKLLPCFSQSDCNLRAVGTSRATCRITSHHKNEKTSVRGGIRGQLSNVQKTTARPSKSLQAKKGMCVDDSHPSPAKAMCALHLHVLLSYNTCCVCVLSLLEVENDSSFYFLKALLFSISNKLSLLSSCFCDRTAICLHTDSISNARQGGACKQAHHNKSNHWRSHALSC